MAKLAVVALVFASLLVASMAFDTYGNGRSLQQQVTYDCNGAKQIATVKNGCSLLCRCAGSLNKNLNTKAIQDQCLKSCGACQAAAATCPKGGPLPQACAGGRNVKEINTCITTFLRSRQG